MFLVLLKGPVLPNVMALATSLAAYRKVPAQDEMMRAKRSWGIVAENLSEPDASALATHLSAGGIPAIAVPEARLKTLPVSKGPISVEFKNDLQFTLPGGSTETVPANALTLIAAAALPITEITTTRTVEGPTAGQKALKMGILLTTGLPIPIGGKKRIVEKHHESREWQILLDLFTNDRHYRIDADHFNYTYLKERKLYQVLANFKLLLKDLALFAPHAQRNHGAIIFLDNKPLRDMAYDSLADFDRESRWRLCLYP